MTKEGTAEHANNAEKRSCCSLRSQRPLRLMIGGRFQQSVARQAIAMTPQYGEAVAELIEGKHPLEVPPPAEKPAEPSPPPEPHRERVVEEGGTAPLA